jgi:hypothetical protein
VGPLYVCVGTRPSGYEMARYSSAVVLRMSMINKFDQREHEVLGVQLGWYDHEAGTLLMRYLVDPAIETRWRTITDLWRQLVDLW